MTNGGEKTHRLSQIDAVYHTDGEESQDSDSVFIGEIVAFRCCNFILCTLFCAFAVRLKLPSTLHLHLTLRVSQVELEPVPLPIPLLTNKTLLKEEVWWTSHLHLFSDLNGPEA